MGSIQSVDPVVSAVFNSYPKPIRGRLLDIRQRIYAIASQTPGVGTIRETLRWNEPTYLTERPKSGTPIRLAWHVTDPKQFGVYVHCQTDLIERFKKRHPKTFTYHKTRALLFSKADQIPVKELELFIKEALLYYKR